MGACQRPSSLITLLARGGSSLAPHLKARCWAAGRGHVLASSAKVLLDQAHVPPQRELSGGGLSGGGLRAQEAGGLRSKG